MQDADLDRSGRLADHRTGAKGKSEQGGRSAAPAKHTKNMLHEEMVWFGIARAVACANSPVCAPGERVPGALRRLRERMVSAVR
jgi:hypothetical protein